MSHDRAGHQNRILRLMMPPKKSEDQYTEGEKIMLRLPGMVLPQCPVRVYPAANEVEARLDPQQPEVA